MKLIADDKNMTSRQVRMQRKRGGGVMTRKAVRMDEQHARRKTKGDEGVDNRDNKTE